MLEVTLAEIEALESEMDKLQEKLRLERAIKERSDRLDTLSDEYKTIMREFRMLIIQYNALVGKVVENG